MRTEIEVDRPKLEAAITLAEQNGPLSNLFALWEAAANAYNTDNPPSQISPAVVGLRIKKWELNVQTKPGKRGRAPLTEAEKAERDANPNSEEGFKGKKQLDVDRVKLEAAIALAEKDGPLSSRSTLLETVADLYNKDNPPVEISSAVVGLRIEKWELPIQTKAGKRVVAEVDRAKLEAAIAVAEKDGPLPNLSALWEAACKIYNADNPVAEITNAIVLLRVQAWEIPILTQPGKRGRAGLSDEEKAQRQTEQLKEIQTYDEGGFGRKQCEGCLQFVGTRVRVCKCGQEFPESVAKAEAVQHQPSPQSMAAQAAGCRVSIWVPAGNCPVKLPSTAIEDVQEWAVTLRNKFRNNDNSWLTLHALGYFAKHFYDSFSPEYALVREHLDTLYGYENQGRCAPDDYGFESSGAGDLPEDKDFDELADESDDLLASLEDK